MIRKQAVQETVLYYTPVQGPNVTKLKGVLVRMGIRIRNVAEEQTGETIGGLLGLPGYDVRQDPEAQPETSAEIRDEVLVMHNFSGYRIDELLLNLRKAGVPKIHLKAVVTETNCSWTFYQLYKEIKEEHTRMQKSVME